MILLNNKTKDKISIKNSFRINISEEYTIKAKKYESIELAYEVIPEENEIVYFISHNEENKYIVAGDIYDTQDKYGIGLEIVNISDEDIKVTGYVGTLLILNKNIINKDIDEADQIKIIKKSVKPIAKSNNIPKGYWKTEDLYLGTNCNITVDKTALSEFPDGHYEVLVSYRKNNEEMDKK